MTDQLSSTSPSADAAPKTNTSVIQFLTLSWLAQDKFKEVGVIILRVLSLPLMLHGFHKVASFTAFKDMLNYVAVGSIAPTLIGTVVVILQIAVPVLLCLGLCTRWAGLAQAIMFAFIILAVNVPTAGWISQQGGLSFEAALLYFVIGIVLFFTGAGRYSIDRVLNHQE